MRTGRILLLALALALTVGTTASGAARTTYFHNTFSNRAEFKPKRILFKDAELTHIRWRGWNGRHAFGRGRARMNNCVPICAAGRIVRGPVKLVMYHRHREGKRWFYRCVKGVARVPGPDQRILWCTP
jgi:hypothetical protein